MNRAHFIFALLVLPAWSSADTVAQQPTLCAPTETVYFSCGISRARIVSVCGSEPLSSTSGSLQYRLGTPKALELAFPGGPPPHTPQFRLYRYGRPLVERIGLSFSLDGYVYTVLHHSEGDIRPPVTTVGVSVSRAASPEAAPTFIPCRGPVLMELPRLETIVPCDKGNALSLGCAE